MAYRSYQSKKSYQPKKDAVIPGSLYKPLLHPSEEQQAIFDFVLDGEGHSIWNALAGCGKTSTCIGTMYKIHQRYPKMTQSYLIFAKKNQEEAQGKAPPSVACKTAHSFGLNALSARYGRIMVDKDKTKRIAISLVGAEEEKEELVDMLALAIDKSKEYLAGSVDDILPILYKHQIDLCNLNEEEFVHKTLLGMQMSDKQPNVVSFADMVYLPIKLGVHIPTFDIVYGDELQDLNIARIELMLRSLGSKGRLCGVGDENQAIFSFTGSDLQALQSIQRRTNAKYLPLHKTFRCAKAIVRLAQQFVPDYLAADSNPEGEVRAATMEEMMGDNGAAPGDFILSRTNAALTKIAMQFLRQRKRVNIQGRDLGDSLISMIKRSKAKDVVSFQSWLNDWATAEIERLTAKKKEYDHIIDKQECLESFCEGMRDIKEVRANIKEMFADKDDDESRIILSSIHKSKGLERNRVFLLEKSFVVKPKTEEERIAERNVRYVAWTRARNSLFLVG